ncbi:MAG: acetyl-CoA carboxylase carboxyl transferase subunit alpha, partial [Flavobacteriales bacterium]
MNYLDFEKPIEDLIEKLDQAIQLGKEGEVDVNTTVEGLEKKIKKTRKEIYENLSPWQKVQM